MAYSNDQTQIRAGLVNYIGALLKSSKFEEKAAKHDVAAVLVEETLKLAQDKDGLFELYVLKPMIRGMILVLKQRVQEMSKLPKNAQVDDTKKEYESIIGTFEKLIDML